MPAPKRERLDGPNLIRAIAGDATIVDEATRTFELSFASDAVLVLRRSWFDDDWLERLGLDPDECDLSRLSSGSAPLLWGHDQFDRNNNVGVIVSARVEKGRGLAQCRLSMRPELDGLWRDIKDKIITNVSAGYQVKERTLVKENEGAPNEYRVTRWLPLEISLCSIPADDTVGVGRNQPTDATRFTIIDTTPNEERTMPAPTAEQPAAPATTERAAPAAGAPATAPAPAAPAAPPATGIDQRTAQEIATAAILADRTRTADITDLGTRAGMTAAEIAAAVNSNTTVDAFRTTAFEAIITRQQATPHSPMFTAGADQIDKTRAEAGNWLLSRAGERIDGKPVDINGNQFRGMTLMEMARDRLEVAGVRTRGLDPMEIAKRAITHSSSDFPILFGNVFNKVLLNAYGIVPDTWRQFVHVGSVSDFRDSDRYRAGTFGELAEVPEGGEYEYGKLGDGEKNPIRAKTKGKMFSLTRQAIINDDLGALVGIVRLMGRGAARSIEIDVYTLLGLNSGNGPTMADTGILFNSTAVTTAGGHANLASSGAAPTIDSIAAMSQAMQTQSFGGDFIDVPPSIFLGPVALAEAVKVLNASQYDDTVNKFQKPNQIRGLFQTIIGTPRLTGNGWYMFADPDVEPVLEVAFLNGVQTPYTEQREGWNVDGIEYKVRLDYGVAAVGYRGARRNPGP